MKKLIPLISILFACSKSSTAQTSITGPAASGTWTKAGSPYLIQTNILIPNGTTLTIEPGVTVNFQGNYRLLVSGRLLAVGTASDTIRFTAANTSTGWRGIRFENTPSTNDSSKISFCSIRYGHTIDGENGGGVYIANFSKISVTHNSITDCLALNGNGGGIYLNTSNAVISDNNISYNHASRGGGISIQSGSPIILNNLISHNDNTMPPCDDIGCPGGDPDTRGGGIYTGSSTAVITHNTITYNGSPEGGGIRIQYGNSIIDSNNISNNNATKGGGIFIEGTPQIRNNTISGNSAITEGGGIYNMDDNAGIVKNKIINNTAGSAGGGIACVSTKITISQNIISNNTVSGPARGGGGINFQNSNPSLSLVSNNIISNNNAANGGAILCTNASPSITNNTIVNNSSVNGGALFCTQSSPLFLNTILWSNTASAEGQQVYLSDESSDPVFTYSNVQGGQALFATNFTIYTGTYTNNIDIDPLFVSPSGGAGTGFDGTTANWELQNISTCINGGKPGEAYPANDYKENIRVVSSAIDIGAIENQSGIPPTATVSGGGTVCIGAQTPDVIFTFTKGTFPFTLQYSINGVAQTPVTGISSLQYVLKNPIPGTYAVVSITDPLTTGNGFGSAEVIVINTKAGFTVNSNKQCLAGNNFVFTNTSTVNSGTLSFVWKFSDTTGVDTTANTSHKYLNQGTYSVKLIATGVAGCKDSVSQSMTLTSFTINTLQDTLKTYADSVSLNGGTGYKSYLWNRGDTTQSITVYNSASYKVTVSNADGCLASDSIYVNFRKRKTLFIDKKQNICSPYVDVSVRVKYMSNVVGLQGSIIWDKSVLKFDSIIYDNSPLNVDANDINISNASNGYLTYSWLDNALTGITAADSTKIFTLRFDKNSFSFPAASAIQFSSTYTVLEIDTLNTVTGTPTATTETEYINGMVQLAGPASVTNVSLEACDSLSYNGVIYYDSVLVTDTLKYAGTDCDSTYRNVNISIYKNPVTPQVSISVNRNNIMYGDIVTFTAAAIYGGNAPKFKWYKNYILVDGENKRTFTTMELNAHDTVFVVMESSLSCAVPGTAISNYIVMQVNYSVTGNIKHPTGKTIPYATVKVSGGTNSNVSANYSGTFSTTLLGGTDYTLKPYKNNDVNKTNGVSTIDIALIQAHILNSTLLNSPYKIIAADVNNSGSVTAIDLLYIKRLILGLDNTFPGNKLWAFTDTGIITTPLNPFPYKDSITYQFLSSNKVLQNFTGVKLGDVNFDWNNAILRPTEAATKAVVFYHDDIKVDNTAGKEIRIPIKVKNFSEILGLQFTINFNSNIFEFKGIENNRLNIEYASDKSNEGKLTFIWNDKVNKLSTLKDGEIIMDLVLDKKSVFTEEEIKVTSNITNAEAWDGKFKKHTVIKEKGKIITENLFAGNNEQWDIIQVNKNSIDIKVMLWENKQAVFDIFNTAGIKLTSYKVSLPGGTTKITIPYNNLLPGIYYIKSTGVSSGTTKKLVTGN